MSFLSSQVRGHATAAPAAWRALGRGGAGYSTTSDHGDAGYSSRAAGTIRRRMQLRALRGAITVEENEADAILSATEELMREVMQRNSIEPDRMVSCIFTCTNDLDAEFPAVAARRLGLSSVPLLCAREIDVPGALPRVIRLLLHCYADPETEPRHVYLRDAESLRRDLQGAQ
jgi:chorismate mutase